ncbi:MAG: twitching mobility protein, partial [Deltaproteobacteria bacterium]|nr:twitching mobility protein [Deltaproteobacteria bacterium]
SGLANVIREGNTPMLLNNIQSGKSQCMQTMDDALMTLVQSNRILSEDAYRKAIDKARFEKFAPAD